nr:RecName: Full=Uncharacterized protein SMPP9 [Nautilus macromphalus]
SFDSSVLTK